MENNEFRTTEPTGTEGTSEPKPLRKLVRVNKDPTGAYQPKHEAPPRSGDPNVHLVRNTRPVQDHIQGNEQQPRRKMPPRMPNEGVPKKRRGKYEAEPKKSAVKKNVTDIFSPDFDPKLARKLMWRNVIVKVGSIVATVMIFFGLVLNVPICRDNKTGKNISLVTLFKNWQPAAKEGQLDKENVKLDIDTSKRGEDFNDGLDLPQLIEGQYSILFLGFEPDEYNTDVMWVLQFDIGNGKLNILQIPRDTCLPDYTSSVTRKFNSIYTLGDPNIQPPIQRTVNAVQENFGIPIDAYVTTTCPDIVDIIDIVGGVPIHLDKEIIFEADKIIPKGDIVLTGQQSEWFIRFRTEWLQGDIGRMQNQRRFMAAAMQKLMSIVENEGKMKLYSYIKEIYEKDLLYTDLSIGDLGKIADFAATISMDNVRVNMVPGEDAMFYAADGKVYSVYSVHKWATIDMLNNYYRPYQTRMTENDTSIVELVTNYTYDTYDDTSATLEELEHAAEPARDPSKKPWWKKDD